MAFFNNGNTSKTFNGSTDGHALTAQMTQAFYRGEHDTIDMYARKGAAFTQEMLITAVNLKDAPLCTLCLDKGVIPDQQTLKFAVDRKDHALFSLMAQKTKPDAMLALQIEKTGSDLMRGALQKALNPHAQQTHHRM